MSGVTGLFYTELWLENLNNFFSQINSKAIQKVPQ